MTFKATWTTFRRRPVRRWEDFWKLAIKNHFVKQGKIVAKHAGLLAWLKPEIGLGHVHANLIILYLRLRANDPKVSSQSKKNGPIAQDTKNRNNIFSVTIFFR